MNLNLCLLVFYVGTTLINEGHTNAGQVINVYLSIMIGTFSLAMLAPQMQGETFVSH